MVTPSDQIASAAAVSRPIVVWDTPKVRAILRALRQHRAEQSPRAFKA